MTELFCLIEVTKHLELHDFTLNSERGFKRSPGCIPSLGVDLPLFRVIQFGETHTRVKRRSAPHQWE